MTDDDDIPPPLIPDPPPGGESSDVLFLPFAIADAPRLQLEFLARHPDIADAHREAIKKWLYSYNVKMIKWIHDAYGPEGVKAADAMSRAVVQKLHDNQKAAREQYERDLFRHLEQEMGKDD